MPLFLTPTNILLAFSLAGLFLCIIYLVRRRRRHVQREMMQAQLAQLEAVRSISYSIAHTRLDPLALARLISAEAASIIDIHNFQVGIFNRSLFDILFWTKDGVEQTVPQSFDHLHKSGLVNWVRRNRVLINLSDFDNPPDGIPLPAQTISEQPRSALYLPLLSSDNVIGVMIAESAEPGYFDTIDTDLLEIVANQAAGAIENAQLLEEERLLANDLEMVSSIARQVNTLSDIDKISEQVVTFAKEQLLFHPVTISSMDEETGEAFNRHSSLDVLEPGVLRSLPEDEGLIGIAMKTRETVLVNDVHSDDRYVPGIGMDGFEDVAERTRSEIVIPLLVRDRLLGLIDVQSERQGGFSQREVRVLEALAQEVAASFNNARIIEAQKGRAWMASAQFNLARTFTEHSDRETMLPAALELTAMLMGFSRCAVFQWRAKARLYVPLSTFGLVQSASDLHPIEEAAWGAANVVRLSGEVRSAEIPNWPTSGSWTIHPLQTGTSFIGIFAYETPTVKKATVHHGYRRELLRSVLRQFARNIERAWLTNARVEEAWANNALLQVAQSMNDLIDLNKILNTIVRLVPMLIGVRTCFIVTIDDDDEIHAGPSYGLGDAARALLAQIADNELDERLTLSASEVEERTELTLYTADLPPEFSQALGDQPLKLMPLHARNKLVGMLAVGETIDGSPLDGRRLKVLAGIAQQAAIAVVNDQLYRESAETERIQNELGVALELQSTLLPDADPEIPGLKIASYWEAAHQISGDFYDFLPLTNGLWGIVIADVAGKGVPAALYMALARTVIRSVGLNREDPLATLQRANELIMQDTQANLFLTVFYAIWDQASKTYTFTNGGHNPPLLLRADGEIEIVGQYGVALGVIEDVPLTRDSINLEDGDTLLFFTDGITEAMNENLEPYGLDRLKAVLAASRDAEPEAVIQAIRSSIIAYADGMMQSDDATMVVMQKQ